MSVETGRRIAFALAAVLAALALAAAAVLWSGRAPAGPVAVPWDRVRCARCGMLVSAPRFAAQAQPENGEVRHYDDPGCLLADLGSGAVPAGAPTWLHHSREERWIRLEEAAFVTVPQSPMGYGLGVVARGEIDGALDLAAAQARMAASADRDGAPR